MKFEFLERFIFDEATIPVESPGTAFTIVIKKLRYIISLYSDFFKTVKENEAFIVNDISALDIDHYFIDSARRLEEDIKEPSLYRGSFIKDVEDIEGYLNVAKTTDDSNFRYKLVAEIIPNMIERIYISFLNPEKQAYNLREVSNAVNTFIKGYNSYGFKDDEPETKLVKKLHSALKDITSVGESIKQYIDRLKAHNAWNTGDYYQGRKFRPEDLQETEIAYHASLQAVQLMQTGFDPNRPSKDTLGLGGGSDKNHISFSLDLKICQSISTTYKHLWLIANKQWTIPSVIEYVRLYTKTPREDKGGKYDLDKIVEIYKRQKGDSFPPKNEAQAMDFYRLALYFINTPVSRNPVFWGFEPEQWLEKLRKIKYSDIGVLKAKIATSNASEFLVAEREIRIPAEDVLEIINIIK